MIITLFLLIFTISYGQHSNYKSLKAKLPIPLMGHITAIYNNNLFVFGGKNDNKFNDKFWKLPLSSFSLNMTNLDIINEPSNTDWIQISVKPPTYGSASDIGIGTNTFVCGNQCSVLVNQYLYIFGSGSFALKQNNFINTIYRLNLSQDPPIFASENDLPITNLNNAKPFCVTAAMGKIYINTPFKTIQYDPMGIELQTIAIQNASWYNVGCTHFKDKIYLFGGTNDLFDTRSYTVGINTTKFHDHTLNVYSRNNIKCISLGPYSYNIECPGGLNVVNHSYPQNSIIWNAYNNSQTYVSLQTSVSQYGLEYYQFYTGTNYNSSIVLVIGGGNNEHGTVKAIDTIQYAIIYENERHYNQITTNWQGSYKPTNELRIDVAERLQSQITRRRLGERKCPKDIIKSKDTGFFSKFKCKNNARSNPTYKCKLDTPQQSKCPLYQHKDVYSHKVTKELKNGKCIYTKHCTSSKTFHCPASHLTPIKHDDTKDDDRNSAFTCQSNKDTVEFICLTYLQPEVRECSPYDNKHNKFSHLVTTKWSNGQCYYTKHCDKKIFHCPVTNELKFDDTKTPYGQSEFTCASNKPIAEFNCKLQNKQQLECPIYKNKNEIFGLSRASYVVSSEKQDDYCYYTKYCEKGKMLNCPKKDPIELGRSDTKSHGKIEGLTCHDPNWKCKSTTETCPKYKSTKTADGKTKEQAVDQGDNKDRKPDGGVCDYTKICKCPESLDKNHVWWKGWGDFKCHYQNGGQHDFKCIIKKTETEHCPEYKTDKDQSLGLSVETIPEALWDSHTLHTTHEICVYKKVCPSSTIKITGAQFKEQKTICEKSGECNIICSPTYCQNEYIKASSGVTGINVYCENDYSCIGEVKINGAVRDSDWGSGFQHRKDGINGTITCGWGNVQACRQSFFGYRKFTNAYFKGNATNTEFIFKSIGNKAGRPGVVKIDVSDPGGAESAGAEPSGAEPSGAIVNQGNENLLDSLYSAPFSGNSIFTQKVKRFEFNAMAERALSASFIDLRGLLNNNGDQKQVIPNGKPSIGAHLKCNGKMSCNGVILLAKTCGGPIDIECNGESSCNGLQIIIQVLKQCGHTSDTTNMNFKNFKVTITSTQAVPTDVVPEEKKANIYVLFPVSGKLNSILQFDTKLKSIFNIEKVFTRNAFQKSMENKMKKTEALVKNTRNKHWWDLTKQEGFNFFAIYCQLSTYKAVNTIMKGGEYFEKAKKLPDLFSGIWMHREALSKIFRAGKGFDIFTNLGGIFIGNLWNAFSLISSGVTVARQFVKGIKHIRHETYYYITENVEQAVPIPAGVPNNDAKADYYDHEEEQYEMHELDKHRSMKKVQNPYNQKIHVKNEKNIRPYKLKNVENTYDKKIHKKHRKSTRIL